MAKKQRRTASKNPKTRKESELKRGLMTAAEHRQVSLNNYYEKEERRNPKYKRPN